MKAKSRQSGLTLVEQTAVIAAIALLVSLSIPAVRSFLGSLEIQGGAKAMISAALSSARAIAAREQRYAGVRFQQKYQPDDKGCQYMIFIVQDPNVLAYGFRAVEGIEPIKLPGNIGVMDLRIRTNHGSSSNDAENSEDESIDNDIKIDGPEELRDTTAFSLIFSPSGKLVIHDVRVRNRDGIYRPTTIPPKDSKDDVFNSEDNIKNYNVGMFIQDDYAHLGLGQEPSRSRFIIYDKTVFEKVDKDRRYSDYLKDLKDSMIYISPYTGTIISR
jgi:Tfp pilus assembly protein PilE